MRPLAKKRATFVIAAGAAYGPGSSDADKNYLVPWLRTLFGFLGLEEMQFILVDGTRDVHRGTIDGGTFLAPHIEAVHAFFAQERTRVEARQPHETTSIGRGQGVRDRVTPTILVL